MNRAAADAPARHRARRAGALPPGLDPTRRLTVAPRPRPAWRLLAVVVALGGVAGTAAVATAEDPTRAPARVPAAGVLGATTVCPDPVGGATTFGVTTTTPGAGSAVLDGDGDNPLLTGGATVSAVRTRAANAGAAVVRATGPTAAGATATEQTVSGSGTGAGLAVASCAAPRRDTWLVGPATDADGDPLLQLSNPDSVPAQAQVTVLTPLGPATPKGGPTVDVGPRATVRLRLAAIAPESPATAVHVVVGQGRVASAVIDRRSHGGVARGIDWVPAGVTPAAQVTVPGMPAADADARRTLVLAAPVGDVTVKVEVLGPGGRSIPVGLEAVPVAGGSVRAVRLGATAQVAGAVRITATGGPVTAGIRLDVGGDGGRPGELTWLGTSGPMTGTAIVPATAAAAGDLGRSLILTAPGGSVDALVDGKRVVVAAGRSLAVTLPTGGAPTVSPGAGTRLLAAVVTSGGDTPLLAALDLTGTRSARAVPAVAADP